MDFPCNQCGNCCTHLAGNALYADLDDGTGVCRYFDTDTRLCKIYNIRPLKCNVKKSYAFFAQQMSWEEYVRKNKMACEKLKRM